MYTDEIKEQTREFFERKQMGADAFFMTKSWKKRLDISCDKNRDRIMREVSLEIDFACRKGKLNRKYVFDRISNLEVKKGDMEETTTRIVLEREEAARLLDLRISEWKSCLVELEKRDSKPQGRLGVITINDCYIRRGEHKVILKNIGFTIVECLARSQFMGHDSYMGKSLLFDVLGHDELIPEYTITVHTEEGYETVFTVERVS